MRLKKGLKYVWMNKDTFYFKSKTTGDIWYCLRTPYKELPVIVIDNEGEQNERLPA